MAIISCDGTVTVSAENYPICDTGWNILSDPPLNPALSQADFVQLWQWAVLILVIGFGIRAVRRLFDNRGG